MSLDKWAQRIHECARSHGFWPETGRNFGEMIALAHSELSEALEEHRSDKEPVYYTAKLDGVDRPVYQMHDRWYYAGTNIPVSRGARLKPEGTATELIDAIVRELDTLYDILKDTPYTIDGLMEEKVAFNEQRPHKHGRAY
jgi:hypothetical protein